MKPRDKNAKIRLPKFYKRLLLVTIVVGPIWWLVFTEDGQRRSDMFLLRVFGDAPFYLNLKVLDGRFNEAELHQLYPEFSWQCKDEATDFGDRYCISRIGSFNDLPADSAALFFRDSGITAVKVNYRHNYHAQLGKDLRYQLGYPLPEAASARDMPDANKVVHWRTEGGHVITKKILDKGEESALLWLSPAQMARSSGTSE